MLSITRSVLLALLTTKTATSFTIPVYFDASNELHRDLRYHPEQPDRITASVKAIQAELDRNANFAVELINVAPSDYTNEHDALFGKTKKQGFTDQELQYAKDLLLQVHDKDLVQKLEIKCRDSKARRVEEGRHPLGLVGYIDEDTYVTTETFDVCLRAAAAWIRAVDAAVKSTSTALSTSMALTRPPGHHALYSQSNGFCLFNFGAVAAVHALSKGLKVSIIDWDVHYGQGITDIIKEYAQARFVSIHQAPAFPYMGEKLEVVGNTLTVPIPPDTTWTCGYQQAFDKALGFVCEKGVWEPDLVIVCAGYDALDSDELASCSLIADDYATMASRLVDHVRGESDKATGPCIILGLEGGYQLDEGAGGGNLQQAVVATLRGLVDKSSELSKSVIEVQMENSSLQEEHR
jgi:acetoin utilization deacetylase AcuC-like enzyme